MERVSLVPVFDSRASRRWSTALTALALGGALVATASADASFIRNGQAGFVVADIKYALAEDAEKTGACPRGMAKNVVEIFAMTAQGRRRPGESEGDYGKRLEAGGQALSTAANGQNVCMNPEAAGPDPYFRTMDRNDIAVDGIDLDGVDSRADAPATAASCPHQDFVNKQGERGVDNQFYRVIGCTRSFQSTGPSNTFAIEMLTGSWGILLTLNGVDDLRNDDNVEVGMFANADPIQLSPGRDALSYATYAKDQDPRFRATARGRIKDGVLTTDPADVRFRHVINSLRLERPLKHARLRVTISDSGVLEGYLGGYVPVEELYDMGFGYRNGKNAAGELGPLRLRLLTANGAARVLGHTCTGIYHSLYKYADGDPDPQSGRCTSLSVQYRIKAIPAFVVDVSTDSVNSKLTKTANNHEK